jgi:hypothetical protein
MTVDLTASHFAALSSAPPVDSQERTACTPSLREEVNTMPKLPELKTESELADFVDAHDTAPYWDEMSPVDAQTLRIKRRGRTAVRVPMTQATLKQLKTLAKQRSVPLDDLLRDWLSQWLKQEQIQGQ